jgi:outer membrane protein TolC
LGGSAVPIVTNIPNNYALKASVLHPLFTGHSIENAEVAADYNAKAADSDLSNDRLELVFSVKNAYWNLYKAIHVKAVLEKNVEQMQQHLEDVKNMVSAGIVLRDEMLKIQVQLSNTRFALSDADNNAKLAAMSLCNLVGLPLNTEVEPTSKLLPADKQIKPLSQYLEDAANNRPDLKSALLRVNASGAAAAAAKGGFYPQVALFGDVNYMRPNPRVFPNRDEFDATWDAGISVSYSLWDWGTVKYRVQQAEAGRSQAEFGLEQLKDATSLDVNQSYLFLKQASERISIAKLGVEQAEESLRVTKNRFAGGFATNTEVLDAEVALLQAQLNFTVATADHEIADAKMKKAVGTLETQE